MLAHSGAIDARRAKNTKERLAAAAGGASASAGPASAGHDCWDAVLIHPGEVTAPAQLPTLQERGNRGEPKNFTQAFVRHNVVRTLTARERSTQAGTLEHFQPLQLGASERPALTAIKQN